MSAKNGGFEVISQPWWGLRHALVSCPQTQTKEKVDDKNTQDIEPDDLNAAKYLEIALEYIIRGTLKHDT